MMRVLTSKARSQSFTPLASSALNGLAPEQYFSRAQGIRPPASLWNVALRPVLKSFSDCVDSFDQVLLEASLSGEIGTSFEILLRNFQDLLYGFSNFEEACEQIVQSLLDPKNAAGQKTYRDFGKKKKTLNDALGRIVNSLKHRSGQLRPLLVTGSVGSRHYVIPSFFVEGYQADHDAMGPDPVVHKGGRSGFSVLRQLRFYFVHLYFLSAWICEILVTLHGRANYVHQKEDEKLAGYIDKAIRLTINGDKIVLPNEFKKPQPDVRYELTAEGLSLLVSYVESKAFRSLSTGRFQIQSVADGYVRSIRLPYFGDNVEKEWD